ncbi:MAG: sigma-70 family RNA polymerase sigma factor [Planctomycetaceae bacterium]|nr:sigma-70 family RNA polymerase sigma factor [Planctomycetaceae bacterium]
MKPLMKPLTKPLKSLLAKPSKKSATRSDSSLEPKLGDPVGSRTESAAAGPTALRLAGAESPGAGSSGADSPLAREQRRSGMAVRPRSTQPGPTSPKSLPSRSAPAASTGVPAGTRAQADTAIGERLNEREERLLKELLSEPMDYIDHPEYHAPGAEERIYGVAEIERPDVTWYRPLMDDFISSRSRGTRTPKSQSSILLTGAQERVLFMKYNFARFQVSEIQHRAAGRALTLGEARSVLRWHAVATQYREQLAETNLALVLAMAKRVRLSEVDFADLIGEGNMALMRSVDKFDCGRGFKFSTYACRAILKAFSRHGIKVSNQRKRFGAEYDPVLEKSNHLETVRATHEQDCADEVKHIVLTNKADLSDIERQVISHRFGINMDAVPEFHGSSVTNDLPRASAVDAGAQLTLEQVGQVIGVTKERVRQIQNKALEKIRAALEQANPDAAREMQDDIAAREGRRSPASDRLPTLPDASSN